MKSLPRFSILAALALGSLGAARAESPDPAQNAAPPSGRVIHRRGPGPFRAAGGDHAEDRARPRGDSLADRPSRRECQISLSFPRHPPCLWAIANPARPFQLPERCWISPSKYSTRGANRFLRAGFAKPHAKNYQNSSENVENRASRRLSEEVTGLPEKNAPGEPGIHLRSSGLFFEQTTRFNLTYVMLKIDQETPKPTLILNIYGLSGGVLSQPLRK